MAYVTEMSDWMGSFLEDIGDFVLGFSPGMMIFLGVLTVFAIGFYILLWGRKLMEEGN